MIFYGEEIGMGENLDVPGRLSVRTPMQWTPYDAGGFSSAAPEDLVRPMPQGDYGYERVSVAGQRGDPDSLMNFVAALMRTRRECAAIGTGESRALETGQDAVLAMRYDLPGCTTVTLNNLGGKRCTAALDLTPEEIAMATDLLSDRRYEAIDPETKTVRLNGYGYRWLRIGGEY